MTYTHRTPEKETIFIPQMDDQELLDTISSFCRAIKKAVSILKKMNSCPGFSLLNPLKSTQSLVVELTEKLTPYIFEACVRNLNVSDELQDALQRSAKLSKDSFSEADINKLTEQFENNLGTTLFCLLDD